MRSLRSARDQRGFTLVEVMVAMMVLLVGVLGTVTLIDGANATTVSTKDREGATNLVRDVIETARSVPYDKLIDSAPDGTSPVQTELQTHADLADVDSTKPGWQVKRRGVVYTLTVAACKYDDDKDGSGTHTIAAEYCAGVPTSASPDSNPDDYRRLTVTARWTQQSGTRNVSQIANVSNPSGGLGPPISSLTPTPVVIDATHNVGQTSIDYTAVSQNAAALHWSADDGFSSGDLSGTGPNWTFTWNLGTPGTFSCSAPPDWVVDGSYLVTAQAFDGRGIPGPVRSATVQLDRSLPAQPCGAVGGLNMRFPSAGTSAVPVVELQWSPNRERDIVGYRVYRDKLGAEPADVLVCDTAKTTCVDKTPPDSTKYASATYYVMAYDGTRGNGPASDPVTVSLDPSANPAPAPPSTLTPSIVNGQPTLTWPEAVPDTGDSILYYRVYRDGTSIGDRYDIAPTQGATNTYTDIAGGTHQYWVTAVDSHLQESDPVGPVTP